MTKKEIEHKKQEFKDRLRFIGISQSEFCRRIGYTYQGVENWKNTGVYPAWLKYVFGGLMIELTQNISLKNITKIDDCDNK